MRTLPAALLALLLLAGCDQVDHRPASTEPAEPDEYAAYLLSRDQARRVVPELAAAIGDALGGRVDLLSGRPDGCRSSADQSTAFEYAVTATIVGTRPDPDLATVARVLDRHGWTVTEQPRTYGGTQRLSAARPGLSVGLNEGDPRSRLVLRSGASCFFVPESERESLLDLDEDLSVRWGSPRWSRRPPAAVAPRWSRRPPAAVAPRWSRRPPAAVSRPHQPRRPTWPARTPYPSTDRPWWSRPMKRQMPTRHDLAPLLQFKRPELSPKRRRLDKALTIDDLRNVAKRRTPKPAFDYTDGAADGEVGLARARQAFADIEFHPSILRDVSSVDTSREVLGKRVALPFGIAPTGFTRMMQAEGEIAGATAATAAGIPFALSTMGTTSIEDVAAADPGGRHWFQLYMWKDRDRSMALVDRAAKAGYDTLLVTVDVPVAGARLRDVRNGMTIPPSLTPRTVVNAIPRPAWWINFLTTEPLAFASLDAWSGTVADLLDTMFDPTVTYEDLAWIKAQWPGKVVVKGVQSLPDAVRLADAGVDAVLLSNHGGRQLDRAPVPFHLLPQVVKEIGSDVEVHLDTGIMSGQDVVAAIAHGAHFTLIGRAYLYGLMAGGREGVDRAIEILAGQVERTMRLLGVTSLDELEPGHVTALHRLAPRP